MFLQITGRAHPLVVRLFIGFFHLRPALLMNRITWDVSVVFSHLQTLGPNEALSLKDLTMKLTMLLLLLSGQCRQTIHLIDIRNVVVSKNALTIRFGDVLKTTKPGHHISELVYPSYSDKHLCVVHTELLRRTLVDLLCGLRQPHISQASRDVCSIRCPRGERKTWHVKARASLHTGLRCAFHQSSGTTLSPLLKIGSRLL